MKTSEEQLIERYFDSFNRHDIDGVMRCFAEDAVVIGNGGGRAEGSAEIRRWYEGEFADVPDGRCDLLTCAAHDGRGAAESLFHGTTASGEPIKAIGAEIIEFAGDRISKIRDYHRRVDG